MVVSTIWKSCAEPEPAPEYTFDQSLPDESDSLYLSSGTPLTEAPSHRDLTPPAIPCLSASLGF